MFIFTQTATTVDPYKTHNIYIIEVEGSTLESRKTFGGEMFQAAWDRSRLRFLPQPTEKRRLANGLNSLTD